MHPAGLRHAPRDLRARSLAPRPGRLATGVPRGRIGDMLRWLTAGEAHGPALFPPAGGLPAGIAITTHDVAAALARRRLGYGRGARMKFEQDEVEFLGGGRHGRTLGGPGAVKIANSEWAKGKK